MAALFSPLRIGEQAGAVTQPFLDNPHSVGNVADVLVQIGRTRIVWTWTRHN